MGLSNNTDVFSSFFSEKTSMNTSLAKLFCRCIKKVRRTVKVRRGTAESAAIAICTRSVLGKRRKTLKKFSCKGTPKITTHRLK